MRRLVAFLSVLVLLAAAWPWLSEQIAIDDCLDAGGRYIHEEALCSFTPVETASTPAGPDHAVIFQLGNLGPDRVRRARELVDLFAAGQDHFVIGGLYPYDDASFVLVFTKPGGEGEVSLVKLGGSPPASPISLGVSSAEEAALRILGVEDADGDGDADVVFCYLERDRPVVAAALRVADGWRVRPLSARPSCVPSEA